MTIKKKLDTKNVFSIVTTLLIMFPYLVYQYWHPFSLKNRIDYLFDPVWDWISKQEWARVPFDGNIGMTQSPPRPTIVGDIPELVTTVIFVIMTVLVYYIIKFSINKLSLMNKGSV